MAAAAVMLLGSLWSELGGAADAAKGAGGPKAAVALAAPPVADPFGPIPSPHDSRNVTFIYDAAKIYTLLAQAGQFVHVELAPDEKIVTIQMSDTVRWIASRVENPLVASRIFFKPTQVGIATTASVVTTGGRKYELLLQSVPEGSYRYQRVSWSYPELAIREEQAKVVALAADRREQQRLEALEISPAVSLETLNWDYVVDGKSDFRPEAVFDDGRFIYLRLPPSAQEWPAVFLVDGKNVLLVDFVRRGPFLVVQRLASGLLLKLDSREVRITRRETTPSMSWLPWK